MDLSYWDMRGALLFPVVHWESFEGTFDIVQDGAQVFL